MKAIDIFFREPGNAAECSQPDLDARLRHLDALHAAAADVLQDRNNRQEALTWAIDHVARLPAPSAQHWPRVFCGPLQNEATAQPDSSAPSLYALELLRMFCESRPADATAILWRYRIEAFERLFEGSSGERHMLTWFGRFTTSGGGEAGAAALTSYALSNRGEVWHLLAWRGAHPHAPVTVAASPHYWAQLDVAATVRSLLQDCPRFWRSDELHQRLRDGQLVPLDSSFFAQELLDLLHAGSGSTSGSRLASGSSRDEAGSRRDTRRDSSRDRRDDSCRDRGGSSRDRDRDRRAAERLLADVGDWLGSTPHAPVSRRLMHLLPEPALLSAFRHTVKQPAGDGRDGGRHAAAEATARHLVFGTYWRSLDDLLLAHAMTYKAVDLWRWLQEDSASLQAAKRALRALQNRDTLPVLWAVQRHAAALPAAESARLLLTEKLSTHLYLHEDIGNDTASLEHLLHLCSISFSRLPSQSQHQLLPEPPRQKQKKHKHGHKKSSKKRKRSTSAEPAVPVADGPCAEVTWQLLVGPNSDQKQVCSVQQLHAVVVLRMLLTWLES